MEREHSRVENALKERRKELRLLLEATAAMRRKRNIPDLVYEITQMIPAAWQYPEVASARITVDALHAQTTGFRETPFRQSAEIRVGDHVRGRVDVVYREERPAEDEGPFLLEERHLIDALALLVGEAIAHREAEEELRRHRARLEELVESRTRELELARHALDRAGEAALWISVDGRFFDVNEQACLLLGYTRAELLRLSAWDMIEGFTPPIVRARFDEIADVGGSQTTERIALRKDRSRFPVEIITSVSEFHGRRFALALVRDITERKRAATELEAARLTAESANRAKSAFLAHMSHEIRTPMNAVLGFAQLLQRDESLGAGQRAHVDTILKSGEHLLGIINDVLEMSKIEAGHVEIERQSFDVRLLISDLEDLFRERARTKGIAFVVEALAGIPAFALGDQRKIRQIIVNLLGNAFKFTKAGKVELRVLWAARGDDRFELRFEVEDTGVGIAPEDAAALFREFQQAAAGRARSGSGLGLAISRRYARLMDGDVSLVSEPGRGSTFTATVLVGYGAAEVAPVSRSQRRILRLSPGSLPKTVLVVDDHAESRLFVGDLFRDAGYRVAEAANGREALAIIERDRPDAVVLDVNMPEMNGVETVKRLRERPDARDIVVVAVSASVLDDVDRAALTSRTDAFVRKPVNATELLGIVGARLGVTYVYEDEKKSTELAVPDRESWTKLDEVARETLPAIRMAAESANARALRALLDEIEPRSPELIGELKRLLDSYDYDGLLALVADTSNKQG